MKIIDSVWWTHQYTHIGAILIRNPNNVFKAYIGVPRDKACMDQDADEQYIYKWGAKLSEKQALGIFPQLIGENYRY